MVVAKKTNAVKTTAKTAVKSPRTRAGAKVAVKAAVKPTPKTPVKRTRKISPAPAPVKSAELASPSKAAADAKMKKPKLVRDSFTMPKPEYAVIDDLKQRAAKLGHPAKKSELLRAAIKVIAGLSDAAFIAAMSAVPPIKTGRPSKS